MHDRAARKPADSAATRGGSLYHVAMPSVRRIIDANANRAREALRVMEEAARFLLNDEKLMRGLKELRHDFAQALSAIPGLEANRDTTGDVGTTVKTTAEQTRESVVDVVIAAGKRLSEALRAIEEYGKTLGDAVGSAGFAASIEKLRYRGYVLGQKLTAALGTGGAARSEAGRMCSPPRWMPAPTAFRCARRRWTPAGCSSGRPMSSSSVAAGQA